jgi:hypothetical protein
MTADDLAELRERLVAMRLDLTERLAARIDGGVMALLGSVGAAIAALDAMQRESEGRSSAASGECLMR